MILASLFKKEWLVHSKPSEGKNKHRLITITQVTPVSSEKVRDHDGLSFSFWLWGGLSALMHLVRFLQVILIENRFIMQSWHHPCR